MLQSLAHVFATFFGIAEAGLEDSHIIYAIEKAATGELDGAVSHINAAECALVESGASAILAAVEKRKAEIDAASATDAEATAKPAPSKAAKPATDAAASPPAK